MLRRILLLVVPVLVFSACGDAGLNAQGLVEVTTADGTVRKFELPSQTRIDGNSPGRFSGSCVLRRTLDAEGNEQWGTIVELRSGGTDPHDAAPLTSVTIMQNTGNAPANAHVELEMGGTSFTDVEGECNVVLPYALPDGVVGFEGSCQVEDTAGNRATVAIELDFAGCTVEG